jgi:hypothetical protein
LKDVPDDRIRAYIIWLPQYGGDIIGEADKLSRSFPDKRVSYFLDMGDLTGRLWEGVLKLDNVAWDVYLLYGGPARWEPDLEAPDFWMHQLGEATKAPRFDQPEFESKLKEMLKAKPRESGGSGESSGSLESQRVRRGGISACGIVSAEPPHALAMMRKCSS